MGLTKSDPLHLEIEDRDRIVAARWEATPEGPTAARLAAVEVDDHDDRGLTMRDLRRQSPPIGNRRFTRRERWIFWSALALSLMGQIVTHLVGRSWGLIVGAPAAIVMIVLILRVVLWRDEQ